VCFYGQVHTHTHILIFVICLHVRINIIFYINFKVIMCIVCDNIGVRFGRTFL
jgi:hypothetical protein